MVWNAFATMQGLVLFTILVLESAHLIWKLRCSWIIENGGDLSKLPTKDEIHNRWVKSINLRLNFDKLQTDTKDTAATLSSPTWC